MTCGAKPAACASCQRSRQRHHLSPAFNPGKLYSGRGVDRSFPENFENLRNSSVITAQTKWRPLSADCVSQHPSRNQPVIGSVEQLCKIVPSTFRDPKREFMILHQSKSNGVKGKGLVFMHFKIRLKVVFYYILL